MGTVSGKVSYKGQVLSSGTVTFLSGGNVVRSSPIAADGTYTVDRVPPGPVKITVVTTRPMTASVPVPINKMDPSKMGASPDITAGPNPGAGKYVPIPKQYEDPDKSGLDYTVAPGSQTKDLELK
jgi:hypothetical protein